MQENERKVVEDGNLTWGDVLDMFGNMSKIQANQTIASETIGGLKKESKIKDFSMVVITLFAGAMIAGLLWTNHSHALANERNNQRWIEYLSQYDFVSQDGEGYNYYNSDVGGDVVNGTENPKETE